MTTPWRVARSLDKLLAQVNAAYPNRSKAADGAIGDAAHAASVSDHNPDAAGVVRARDYTHDPAHGFDAHAMADQLVASRDPRIKYVISRGRIASSTIAPWTWRPYTGTNRHDHHAHVSVVADSRADDTRPWTITKPPTHEEDDMAPTVNEIWTTDLTTKGTLAPLTKGESALDILTRVARNVETVVALEQASASKIAAAVVAALPHGEPVDVDQLARRIVVELGKES